MCILFIWWCDVDEKISAQGKAHAIHQLYESQCSDGFWKPKLPTHASRDMIIQYFIIFSLCWQPQRE